VSSPDTITATRHRDERAADTPPTPVSVRRASAPKEQPTRDEEPTQLAGSSFPYSAASSRARLMLRRKRTKSDVHADSFVPVLSRSDSPQLLKGEDPAPECLTSGASGFARPDTSPSAPSKKPFVRTPSFRVSRGDQLLSQQTGFITSPPRLFDEQNRPRSDLSTHRLLRGSLSAWRVQHAALGPLHHRSWWSPETSDWFGSSRCLVRAKDHGISSYAL
jgi:hypothetical protein